MTEQPNAPSSFHRGESELPFVPYQEGVTFQLLQVDLNNSLWVIRVRFEPGVTINRHRHTGDVLAFTTTGAWQYLEYPEVNVVGSYLYEPAGSIHTLHVPDTNTGITDVWFAIRGANLDLDDDNNVISIIDAGTILDIYRAQCAEIGISDPDVIGA
jgi:2,4'-dihydroxyacetophenone dioxygenase